MLTLLALTLPMAAPFVCATAASADDERDLAALEVAANNVMVPASVTSTDGETVQDGLKTWRSYVSNNSQTPVTETTVSVESGYDPALFFVPGTITSFPWTETFGTVEPGQEQFTLNLNSEIPVQYTLGFDSTKSVSPTTIPPGGGRQTITITMTPTDDRYLHDACFNIGMGSMSSGMTVESATDPTNLDQGESVRSDRPGNWQLDNVQLNKRYTFTAVVFVPNRRTTSFEFQPFVQIDGSVSRPPVASTEKSVRIDDPTLDGEVPGSGAFTFSVAEPGHTWEGQHDDSYIVGYEGIEPPEPTEIPVSIEVKPGSEQPASINPRSNGTIPVAVLSTDSFNAADSTALN